MAGEQAHRPAAPDVEDDDSGVLVFAFDERGDRPDAAAAGGGIDETPADGEQRSGEVGDLRKALRSGGLQFRIAPGCLAPFRILPCCRLIPDGLAPDRLVPHRLMNEKPRLRQAAGQWGKEPRPRVGERDQGGFHDVVSSASGTSRTDASMKRSGSRSAAAGEARRFAPVPGRAIGEMVEVFMAASPSGSRG